MKTALTIGFFDGVHLGHQYLLKKLRAHPHATILTFSTHPKELFNPPAPPQLLPLNEKLSILRNYADQLLVLPFNQDLANLTYNELLSQFDLSHLILGEGAVFGHNREGNETRLRAYAKEHGFTVEYLPKILFEGEPISSSRIRKAIASGQADLAAQLLGNQVALAYPRSFN